LRWAIQFVVLTCLVMPAASAEDFTGPGWYIVLINGAAHPSVELGPYASEAACKVKLDAEGDSNSEKAFRIAQLFNTYRCRHLTEALPKP
jgi:hypothetical protein